MRIVPASFEIIERNEKRGNLDVIEKAARVCYKSENLIKEGSADKLVKKLIEMKHMAMLEHGDYIFEVPDKLYDWVEGDLNSLRRNGLYVPRLGMTKENGRCVISFNIREQMESLGIMTISDLSKYIDPIYCTTDGNEWKVKQLRYSDLRGEIEQAAHIRASVRFVVDRGVSHELVRHRLFSFAQESTRYCNYSHDKFGNKLTFIKPCFLQEGTAAYETWMRGCMLAEDKYFEMLDNGCTPQEARCMLPTGIKTEVIVTGPLYEWKHFFDLRARQITGPAHPQMVEIAKPLYEAFKMLYPEVFYEE